MLSDRNIRVGVHPALWSNDDFSDLGGDIPLGQCLREARDAGYAGIELGRHFPRDPDRLREVLDAEKLLLVSGRLSLSLVKNGLDAQRPRFEEHLRLLKALGCSVVIVVECTGEIYTQRASAIIGPARPSMSGDAFKRFVGDLETLAAIAEDEGLTLVYQPHMGTLVQAYADIDRLMDATKKTRLLADTGHLAFAGAEPVRVFGKYKHRIGHVHLRDVRTEVLKSAYNDALSFGAAVRAGVFTVPGDGRINFKPLFAFLAEADYSGWVVVADGQDPAQADPSVQAKKARDTIRNLVGL